MGWDPYGDLKKHVIDPAVKFASDPINLYAQPISGALSPVGATILKPGVKAISGLLSGGASSGGGGGSSEEGGSSVGGFELPDELKELLGIAAEAGKDSLARSKELWDVYKTTFLPGTESFARGAFAGIPADQAAGRATATVQSQFQLQRKEFDRRLTSLGIDISSPAAVGARAQSGMSLAAARAGAANNARANVRDVNFARRGTAANLGLNILGASQGAQGQGAGIIGQSAGLQANMANAQAGREFAAGESALNRAFQTDMFQQQQSAQADALKRQERSAFFSTLAQMAGMAVGSFAGPLGAAAGGAAAGPLGNAFSTSSSNRNRGSFNNYAYA